MPPRNRNPIVNRGHATATKSCGFQRRWPSLTNVSGAPAAPSGTAAGVHRKGKHQLPSCGHGGAPTPLPRSTHQPTQLPAGIAQPASSGHAAAAAPARSASTPPVVTYFTTRSDRERIRAQQLHSANKNSTVRDKTNDGTGLRLKRVSTQRYHAKPDWSRGSNSVEPQISDMFNAHRPVANRSNVNTPNTRPSSTAGAGTGAHSVAPLYAHRGIPAHAPPPQQPPRSAQRKRSHYPRPLSTSADCSGHGRQITSSQHGHPSHHGGTPGKGLPAFKERVSDVYGTTSRDSFAHPTQRPPPRANARGGLKPLATADTFEARSMAFARKMLSE